MSEDAKILEDIGQYKYGFHDPEDKYVFKSRKGLDREVDAILEKRREGLRLRFGADASFRFRVVVEGGQVRLKASKLG